MNHMDDTTSLVIGRNPGVNTDFSLRKQNTFVSSDVERMNTIGDQNSFFGWAAGEDNTTGSNSSFF